MSAGLWMTQASMMVLGRGSFTERHPWICAGKGLSTEAVAEVGVPAAALHIMLNTNAAAASEAAIDVLNRFAMAGKLAQQHLASEAAHLP